MSGHICIRYPSGLFSLRSRAKFAAVEEEGLPGLTSTSTDSKLFTDCSCCCFGIISNPPSLPSIQCSRLKSSMPFKCDLALQNIPLSKQPFKTQPQFQNEDITWSLQYNLPATRTNKRRALSPQEVELDGWFLILRIILKTCTTYHSCTSLIWVLCFISIAWIDILDLNQPFNWRP